MKFRRIQKKMTDLIDADMSEAVDVMKGLEIFEESKSKPEARSLLQKLKRFLFDLTPITG